MTKLKRRSTAPMYVYYVPPNNYVVRARNAWPGLRNDVWIPSVFKKAQWRPFVTSDRPHGSREEVASWAKGGSGPVEAIQRHRAHDERKQRCPPAPHPDELRWRGGLPCDPNGGPVRANEQIHAVICP